MIFAIFVPLLSIFLAAANSEERQCGIGWTKYKDEKCVKSFNMLLNYDEAEAYCSAQQQSSLVTVKDVDFQMFLENFTQHHYNNMWLGSKYNDNTGDFIWSDGTKLTYSNWLEGYRGNVTRSGTCVELNAADSRTWDYVSCKKRNLVMCQRSLNLPSKLRDKVQTEIRKIYNLLEEAKAEINDLKKKLGIVSSRVVPIGYIYVEYNNQPSPPELWPDFKWKDVTSEYEGLFFRASGGGAAEWGTVQHECAPRAIYANHPLFVESSNSYSDNVPPGFTFRTSRRRAIHNPLRSLTTDCEIRPRNQAIRIWKRVG